MARFEHIGKTMVNVDKIRACYRRAGEPDVLIVELDNGETCEAYDKYHVVERNLEGSNFITQVIPCTKPLYARYQDEYEDFDCPIYYLALCADGCVRPLDACTGEWIDFADDTGNYAGLYSERLRKGNK